MKKILFLGLALSFQSAFSQVSMSGNKLIKDGISFKSSKYEEVLDNKDAQNYFKKARTNKTVGEIFAYTGGFTLGFGIAKALQGTNKTITVNGSPQTVKVEKEKGAGTLIGIGIGLVGIGIPFAIAANKNAKKAIAVENGESTAFLPYFKVETAGNGLALSYHF